VKIDSDSISLRPAAAEDDSFILDVYKSSRGDDLRGLGWDEERISEFLSMQYDAQQKFHAQDYQHSSNELISCDDRRAGFLITERREHEIRCVDLALLPEYRNRGIGSLLMRQLQDQARAEEKPIRLQVIRFNRAVNFFERLGFERTSETGTHFQMEWSPRGKS
jgi:ribosomal protein S18 acetylase RimI-like enzyme